jgi:3',5'-cyclic AMP phosphodiesterase CpdA
VKRVYWIADGCGSKVNDIVKVMIKWIRKQADATLIIYGGDVYGSGTSKEFSKFLDQFGGQVSEVSALPGNHDWRTAKKVPGAGEIADGYETFWSAVPPPASRTMIRADQVGSARYDYFNDDVPGWRLVFVDTSAAGDDEGNWPRGIAVRVDWLAETLRGTPGRSKILFTHHSRLSCGNHGDQDRLQKLWESLFDGPEERPLVSLTVAGHDHNVSIYAPRGKQPAQTRPPATGISILVNGAGGRNHNEPEQGTPPEMSDVNNFCISRISFLDSQSADVEVLSFGTGAAVEPKVLDDLTVRIRN